MYIFILILISIGMSIMYLSLSYLAWVIWLMDDQHSFTYWATKGMAKIIKKKGFSAIFLGIILGWIIIVVDVLVITIIAIGYPIYLSLNGTTSKIVNFLEQIGEKYNV